MSRKLKKGHAQAPSVLTNSTTSLSQPPSSATFPLTTPALALGDGLSLPRLVVFDLDFTLWPFWVDTHLTPPLKARPNVDRSAAVDRTGESYGFYPDVPQILAALTAAGVRLAAASRTHAPDLAREMLKLLHVPVPDTTTAKTTPNHTDKSCGNKFCRALEAFNSGVEIYPGSKIKHIKALARETGVPFAEMLFFDDESRNKEVESLGVTMCLVVDGISWAELDRGIRAWRTRRGIQ